MSGETYAIVFKGEIVDGFDGASVQAHLSKLLKTDAKKTAALFSGKQIVLKKTTDKAEAAKYGKALKKAGADVKIRVIKAAETPAAMPQFQKAEPPVFQKAEVPSTLDEKPPAFKKPAAAVTTAAVTTAAAPDVGSSALTLAPNEGDLFEPQPEPEAPALDLSEYSLADNDGAPLVKPREEVEVDIDVSGFSVAENDGSPLVEPHDEPVPAINVPDFGLDEPGAVLETLKEEKAPLNPNTMGMSLAAAGADLLEDDERPPGPALVSPDTSKINLVPNFDT